jgi:hypothetical protein
MAGPIERHGNSEKRAESASKTVGVVFVAGEAWPETIDGRDTNRAIAEATRKNGRGIIFG